MIVNPSSPNVQIHVQILQTEQTDIIHFLKVFARECAVVHVSWIIKIYFDFMKHECIYSIKKEILKHSNCFTSSAGILNLNKYHNKSLLTEDLKECDD